MRRKGSLQQLFNGWEEKFPNLFEMLNLKMTCAFNPNPTDDVSSEDQTHVILIRRSEEEPPPTRGETQSLHKVKQTEGPAGRTWTDKPVSAGSRENPKTRNRAEEKVELDER